LIYSDYSQLEVVILACYIDHIKSKDVTLQNAIRDGKDVHSVTTAKVYSSLMKTNYTPEFIQANKENEPYCLWRTAVKAVTFAIIYGGTPTTISRTTGIPLDDTKVIYKTFLAEMSGIQSFMFYQKTDAWAKNAVDTIAGHRRQLPITRLDTFNKRAYNVALNHPIQGTASYIVNIAMIELHKRLKSIGGNILLTVHDSILSQVPNDKVEEGLKLYKECLLAYPKFILKNFLTVPLKIDLKVGTDWHNLRKV
jgi:DNA polymerase-1